MRKRGAPYQISQSAPGVVVRHLRMQLLPAAAGLALALAVSGCTSLLAGPAPSTYDLTALETVPGLRGGTRAQLLVLEPTALKVLDSEQIVIKPSEAEVEYIARAQWTDRLPKVVQAKLVETFENTGRARAVSKPGEGLVIDYQLASDIRAFEANLQEGSVAKVSISVKLVSDRTGRVVRTRVFTASVPLGGTGGLAVATALDDAFDLVSADIVKWTYSGV
ncbi:ABC-type transport auxiliary lipoprotein family protein [Salaquimonas pukyongi]|uniref:ABC-type transport auxiliary lipoprotein family protein n=1 Tax=Salaquimonas pukyongi TaxID=2712698 RepID=UPI0009FB107C|nr:ABC-type transport auxiliary lipoprotein family protein [Salaquimonas pukyongi]